VCVCVCINKYICATTPADSSCQGLLWQKRKKAVQTTPDAQLAYFLSLPLFLRLDDRALTSCYSIKQPLFPASCILLLLLLLLLLLKQCPLSFNWSQVEQKKRCRNKYNDNPPQSWASLRHSGASSAQQQHKDITVTGVKACFVFQ